MARSQSLVRTPSLSAMWNIKDWRMLPKMLGAFLVIAILPLAVTGVVSANGARGSLLSQARVNLQSHSHNTGAAIDEYLLTHRQDIELLSKLPEISAYADNPNDVAARANALKTLTAAATKTDYESVAVMDNQGTIILSSAEEDVGSKNGFRLYFQEAEKGTIYISDPSVSVITNQPAIFFSAPVRDAAGNIDGVIRSRLSLSGIWNLDERDKDSIGAGTVGILLDENGIRIGDSATQGNRDGATAHLLYRAVAPLPAAAEAQIVSEKRFGQATANAVPVLSLPEVAVALQNPAVTDFESAGDNSSERYYAAMTALTAKPWHYVLMAPLPVFTVVADTLMSQFVTVMVLVAVVALFIAWLMARALTTPIIRLTQVADRISLGELNTEIGFHQKDEIGDLAEAVSRMQDSLKAAVERLRSRRTGG